MKKSILFLLICLYNFSLPAVSKDRSVDKPINDGPYVFYINDTLKARMIENNVLREYIISSGNFSEIKKVIHLSCSYNDLLDVYSQKADYSQTFSEVDSVFAISDVHGQYVSFINLLIINGIIDKNLNWNFGKGHLVFLGDAFDRGDMVTELLWILFNLEKQAVKAGGMVHVLLGNHENMVLSGDLNYINEKYKKTEELTGTKYTDLYSENSVLGKWLRLQPVMISINDILFVHAGISIDLVKMKLTVKQVNNLYSNKIIGKEIAPGYENIKVTLLSGKNGPLWYRGYFEDSTFSESRSDSILRFYNKKHIIVGHTTFKTIKSLYGNKIIGIDAGIGYKQPGEVLIYKNKDFYIGTARGERIKL